MSPSMVTDEFKNMEFPILLRKDDDGYFIECPLFEGCYTQGDTAEEAFENIKEVIGLCLEEQESQSVARNYKNHVIEMHLVSV